MNGNLWYEVARQRVADGQRDARRASEARQARDAARTRRARGKAPQPTAPLIPDYAHEMFADLGDAVPEPRRHAERGRRAQSSR